jgi:hypothetical protein
MIGDEAWNGHESGKGKLPAGKRETMECVVHVSFLPPMPGDPASIRSNGQVLPEWG